jgi:putative DNA primase/helicase
MKQNIDMALSTDKLTDFELATHLLNNVLLPTKVCEKRWFVYQNGVWRLRTRSEHRPVVLAAIPVNHRTAKRERGIIDLIEGLNQADEAIFQGASFYADDDAKTIMLNAQNGVLRITADKIELLEHDPKYLFTRSLKIDYKPNLTCPLYEKTLKESLPDPLDQNLFQLCLGNFLLPDCRFETVLVCYGEAACGKSTLADPVTDIFGNDDDGLMTHLSLAQICEEDSRYLAKIRNASVNLGTEVQGLEIGDSGILKQIVSGEAIEARNLYCNSFKAKPVCKLWFLTNNLPQFKNGTDAERRRIKFLRFDQKPKIKDVMLKHKLKKEHHGLFNFILTGLQRLLTLPEMPEGGISSQQASSRFSNTNDPIGSFVSQSCIMGPDKTILKGVLEKAYVQYVETHNFSDKISGAFYRQLYSRFTSVSEDRVREGGKRVRRVTGLTLTPEALADLDIEPDMTPIA